MSERSTDQNTVALKPLLFFQIENAIYGVHFYHLIYPS